MGAMMKMTEKESVLEILKTANKAARTAAAEGGHWCPEEERCVDALKRLKAVEIPREVVVNSKMGKRLFRLKNHPAHRIKELSCDVITAMRLTLYRSTLPAADTLVHG